MLSSSFQHMRHTSYRIIVFSALCIGAASGQQHQHFPTPHSEEGWLAEWEHRHMSSRGTPYIHAFSVEPAYLGRELIVDYLTTEFDGETEQAVEAELEWALTNRLGMTVALPFRALDGAAGRSSGLGDFGIAPRMLLIDNDRFLLSAQIELELPTGREEVGANETAIGPSMLMWLDLGNWCTLQAQVGTEHDLNSDEAELAYACALGWSFRTTQDVGHNLHHAEPGLINLSAELTGRTGISGSDDGRTTTEVLLGVSYTISNFTTVRAGYQFPVGGPEGIDHALIISVVLSF